MVKRNKKQSASRGGTPKVPTLNIKHQTAVDAFPVSVAGTYTSAPTSNQILIKHSEVVCNKFREGVCLGAYLGSRLGVVAATLSQVFEYYRFKKLRIRTLPHSATTATMLVGIRVDCDPTDAVPDSFSDFINGGLATAGAVYRSLTLDIPISSLNAGALNDGWRYCRVGAPGLNDTDRRSTEAGQLTLYADGEKVIPVLVEYEMEFKQIQIQRVPSGSILESDPLQDGTKYAYHKGDWPSVQVDEKVPALLTMPNDVEIAAGADPDFALMRFFDNYEGTYYERMKANPATVSFGMNEVLEAMTTLQTGLVNSTNDAFFRNLAIRAIPGNWMQPYGLDATNPITSLLGKFTAGRYNDLLLN
jgi:hypothetical protein